VGIGDGLETEGSFEGFGHIDMIPLSLLYGVWCLYGSCEMAIKDGMSFILPSPRNNTLQKV
jgi:hypothetical protein